MTGKWSRLHQVTNKLLQTNPYWHTMHHIFYKSRHIIQTPRAIVSWNRLNDSSRWIFSWLRKFLMNASARSFMSLLHNYPPAHHLFPRLVFLVVHPLATIDRSLSLMIHCSCLARQVIVQNWFLDIRFLEREDVPKKCLVWPNSRTSCIYRCNLNIEAWVQRG